MKNKSNLLTLYILNIMFLILAGILDVVAVLVYYDEQELNANGITTEATIDDRFITTGNKGGKTYNILYHYRPMSGENKDVYIREMVAPETYEQVAVHSSIKIRYLPANPRITQLINDNGYNANFRLWVFGGAIVTTITWFVLIAMIVKTHRNRRKQRQMFGFPSV